MLNDCLVIRFLVLVFLSGLLFAVAAESAESPPGLTIARSGGEIVLSWPASLTQGFSLQATTDLSAQSWALYPDLPSMVGDKKQVAISAQSLPAVMFFRLSCQGGNLPDLPDAAFEDTNCDGIDGDLTAAIFVATSGSDDPSSGLSPSNPCRTINYAIARASAEGRSALYIQAGDYVETLVLRDGVSLYGGYDTNWVRSPNSEPGHTVRIFGAQAAGGEWMTVFAERIFTTATLADLELHGPDPAEAGKASYCVASFSSALRIERVLIVAGDGTAGAPGTDGLDAEMVSATPSMDGAAGGDAREYVTACNDSSHGGGGAAGTNPAAGSFSNGGRGGPGGEMDSDCSSPFPDYDATPGDSGNNAPQFTPGGYGTGGAGAAANTLLAGGDGKDGRIQNGTAGEGGAGYEVNVEGFWVAKAGQDGALGENGGGGGGGGGSGGDDSGTDAYGAGGGGGGAGGLAARGGGGAGQGGGGSFGIYALNSSLSVDECVITRGQSGNGGPGGIGGQGQSGGQGGPGGAARGAAAGGRGGNGGHGGHGGGGGGGSGGTSAAIFLRDSTAEVTNTDYVGGAPGEGGPGGASAPNAPPAESDGNRGGDGSAGQLHDLFEFLLFPR